MTTITRERGRPTKAEAAKEKSYDRLTRTKWRPPTKRVFICSPYGGDTERNAKKAREYCRFAFDEGYVPVCPHIYYPQFLDEYDKCERAAGLKYGMEAMWQCREVWVFGTKITMGMGKIGLCAYECGRR